MIAAHAGEILSTVAAVLWAFSLVLFRKSGEKVHPIALNTFKDILAAILYVPTIYLFGETLFHAAPAREYWLMILSGAIGIGIGDTLLFFSLNMIGAGAYALVGSMYSPIIIGLSYLFLDERLTGLQLLGTALIVTAVLEAARGDRSSATRTSTRDRVLGMALGILGLLTMGVGVVIVKPLLDGAPLFWAVEIRLIGGIIVLLVILALHPKRREIIGSLFVRSHGAVTVTSSITGGYLAMACWLAGIQLTKASIASALNQTYTIFTLIFAALILRERITPLRVLAIVTALVGAMLVIYG